MKKLSIVLLCFFTSFAYSETFFSDHSISLLQGSDYELGDSDRTVLTFEHVSAHSWGDVFAFVDRLIDGNDGGAETYIEVSPNFNLKKLGDGFVKNIKLATTWEMASHPFNQADNFLIGLGSDLNVPGFAFFSASVYQRFNDSGEDNQQLTLVWGMPISAAGQNFFFDGFLDYTTELNGNTSANFTPQLKWDAAKAVGYNGKLYVGIEYVSWAGKFNSAVDESNVNLLLKAHF